MIGIVHHPLKPTELKILLVCRIFDPLLYVSTNILAGNLYAGYSFTSQAVSELFAIGAPTSHLVVPLFTIYDVLLIAFTLGIWVFAAGRNIALSIMALMMVENAVNGLVLWNLFPMHMRGVEPTFTDTIHAILASNHFVLLTVGLGVAAFLKWFLLDMDILIIFVHATLAFFYIPQLITNHYSLPKLELFHGASVKSLF